MYVGIAVLCNPKNGQFHVFLNPHSDTLPMRISQPFCCEKSVVLSIAAGIVEVTSGEV
jgi:hypothetical protein